MPNGNVVVATSNYIGSAGLTNGPLEITTVTAQCKVDEGFGTHGVVRIAPPNDQAGATIQTAVAVAGGDVIVLGSTSQSWLIGELDDHGALVSSFGSGGWVELTPSGSGGSSGLNPYPSTVVRAPSGTLLVAGTDGQPHCCERSLVYALNASGAVEASYGTGGYAIPLVRGAYIDHLIVQSNGSIAVVGSLVYAGCGSTQMAWLTPLGAVDQEAQATYQAQPSARASNYDFSVAFGDHQGGVGLVGWGTANCFGATPGFNYLATYRTDGSLDPAFGKQGRSYPLPVHSQISSATQLAGGAIVATFPETAKLTVVTEYRRNGSVNAAFGKSGSLRVATWAPPGSYSQQLDVTAIGESAHSFMLVTPSAGGFQLRTVSS